MNRALPSGNAGSERHGTVPDRRSLLLDAFAAIERWGAWTEPAEQRLAHPIERVWREIATVPAVLDGAVSLVNDEPFSGLGLDWRASVELRNRSQLALGRTVSAASAFEWPGADAPAAQLNKRFGLTRVSEVDSREALTL